MIKSITNVSKSKTIVLMMEIRDLVNSHPRQTKLLKDSRNWQKLCSSMDTIEDVEEAINEYQRLPEFSDIGSGYLYLYGLFQTMYVQQDAIRSLSKVLLKENINFKKDYPNLFKVREIRNDIFGHPTDSDSDRKSHIISRITMTKASFDVLDYYDDCNKFRTINVLKAIEQQSKDIEIILERIKNELEKPKVGYK